MAVPRMSAAEREREAREETQRRTRLSMRLGAVGILLLFASALGAWLASAYIVVFLGGMGLGLVLLLAAFLLVRGFAMRLGLEPRTKLY